MLGVELTQEKLDKIYEEFLKLADKKKDINDDDILVLAGADRTQNHRIKLEYLQVTSGVGVRSVASLGLNISGEKFEAAASGNGPVDAAIKALKKIIDRQMTLKEFTIQAISKGSDDMGKVHMQVEYDNRIYYGFGSPFRLSARVATTWVRYTCRWSTTTASITVLVPIPISSPLLSRPISTVSTNLSHDFNSIH